MMRRAILILAAIGVLCIGKDGRTQTRKDDPDRADAKNAWESFYQGTVLLEKYAPRSEVLTHWEASLKAYGQSRYAAQLRDHVAELKKQVEEDKQLATNAIKEPEKLPEKERIAYCIARFPDVHGVQFSEPGHCLTVGMGEGTRLSDMVVKVGRPAVPALLEHLTDRRLTRSIGFRRSFDPARTVLRVQDVAVQCIERILDLSFYRPRTTSSYFSTETAETREALIAEIKAWWKEYGDKPPVQGYVGRLEKGSLSERLEILQKIEKLDKSAVDSIAVLKRWAAAASIREQPYYAELLAARGDLSLLASMREMLRGEPRVASGAVPFMLKHGNAEDYRVIREAALKDHDRGAELGSGGMFSAAAGGLERTKNPLAAPLLVDLLDQRKITGARYVDGRGIGFSCADTCMETLIGLTGHNEGYAAGDPDEKRYAAIDRWLAWWKREGKAAFIRKHPHVQKVYGEPDESPKQIDVSKLPRMVRVELSERGVPISYEVPRSDLAALLSAGSITVRRDSQGEPQIRFVSQEAALTWFKAARPQPAAGASALVSLERFLNWKGPSLAPDGRAWFSLSVRLPSIDDLKRSVEQAFQGPQAFIKGASELHVDRQGRIWLVPYNGELLIGYDPKSRQWTERRELVVAEPGTPKNYFCAPVFESKTGRLYFPDRLGVHVLDGMNWSYQPLFARNIRENAYESNIKAFNPLVFREDAEGRVYLWAGWGTYGWTGTIGYWVHDGAAWKNVDAVKKLDCLLPRSSNEVWLLAKGQPMRVTDGKVDAEANKALCPGLQFRSAYCAAVGLDGTTYLCLQEVTVLPAMTRHLVYAVAVPLQGPVRELGEEAGRFLERVSPRGIVATADGWIWGSNGGVMEGMSTDGKRFRKLTQTQQLSYVTPRKADAQGRLYLTGNGILWRLDTRAAGQSQEDGHAALPAMRINHVGLAWPDSLGRMWCTWNVAGSPTARFDGKTWKTFPIADDEQRSEEPRGFISAFPGANGAMVFVDERHRFHLYDADGWVMASTAPALALEHGERLRKALTYPPLPSDNYSHHLVKDANERIWWAHWFYDWGVIDNGKAIDGRDAGLKVGSTRERRAVFSILFPLGNESRMLAGDEHGNAAIVGLADGKLVKHADSPGPIRDRPPYSGWQRNVLRDSLSRLWVVSDRESWATDQNAKRVASHAGRLLLEDRRQGLWFREVSSVSVASLVRPDSAGNEVRLVFPQSFMILSLAEAPDDTVWALTTPHLLRLRPRRETLTIVEKYLVPSEGQIWCDREGRVWQQYHDSWQQTLICYATPQEAGAKK